MLLDLKRLDPTVASKNLKEMGLSAFNSLTFLDIIRCLNLSSDSSGFSAIPPTHNDRQRSDLSVEVENLKHQGRITDVIGSLKFCGPPSLWFSTLVFQRPKAYLSQYADIVNDLLALNNDLSFNVWLEDRYSEIAFNYTPDEKKVSVKAYETFFRSTCPSAKIMVCSESGIDGVPMEFAVEKFSLISAEEFLSALPFHKRQPISVKVLDVVHFAWNCYIMHHCPGIHLAGTSSKRHFQLFRKVLGKQVSVILVPMGSAEFAK